MTKHNFISSLLLTLALIFFASCKKFLETKSAQNLATPSSLNDLEAILNNNNINKGAILINGMTDEYYYAYTDWLSRNELQKNGYTWDSQLNNYTDWSTQYYAVFNANTVLFNLQFINAETETARWNTVKGMALFYRALAHYRIAQLYAPQFDPTSASTDLGIPLRLTADINEVSFRSSIRNTYDQIIADLNEALNLVPNNAPISPISKTLPTKAAVYGLLARIYLQIGDYVKAQENANACLSIHSVLLDFNNPDWVTPNAASPFKVLNPEIIFYSMSDASPNSNVRAKVDSTIYNSYSINDLRKSVYFNRNSDNVSYRFKGSYSGNLVELFCGIATDEILLIRAECLARNGNTALAMKDYNDLLRARWRKVNNQTTYVDQVAPDAGSALDRIILERKKELLNRELRWSDLKRLNKETRFATTIFRNLNGQIISLSPNDLRYSLLIPIEVMRITNLQQNPR